MILRALALASCPAQAFNLTGESEVSVRTVATRLGELLGRPATLVGVESNTALLNNPERLCQLLGPPPTALDTILLWTAHWVKSGGRSLNKPTHFEVRDGTFDHGPRRGRREQCRGARPRT